MSLSDSLSFPGQQARQPSALSCTLLWHCGGTSAPGFPWESYSAIPRLFNTLSKPGELQLWCIWKEWFLSVLGSALRELSQQVGLVFNPQKTVRLPLLSRPIILAVYERILSPPSFCLPPLSHTHTHKMQPETFYYPFLVSGWVVFLFWDIFLVVPIYINLRDWCDKVAGNMQCDLHSCNYMREREIIWNHDLTCAFR